MPACWLRATAGSNRGRQRMSRDRENMPNPRRRCAVGGATGGGEGGGWGSVVLSRAHTLLSTGWRTPPVREVTLPLCHFTAIPPTPLTIRSNAKGGQNLPAFHLAAGQTTRPGVVVRMLYSVPPPVMYSVRRSS